MKGAKMKTVSKIKRLEAIIAKQAEEIRLLKKTKTRGRKPLAQDLINMILELRDNGATYRDIEKKVGVSRPIIAKYLKLNGRIKEQQD